MADNDVECSTKGSALGHSFTGLEECPDVSMVTNVGSTIGEDAHLSDCEVNDQSNDQAEVTREDHNQYEQASFGHDLVDSNIEQCETTPSSQSLKPSSPLEKQNDNTTSLLNTDEGSAAMTDSTTPLPSNPQDAGVNNNRETIQDDSDNPSTTNQLSLTHKVESSPNSVVETDNTGGDEIIETNKVENNDDSSSSKQLFVAIDDKPAVGVAQSSSVSSIYLDDGGTCEQKDEKKIQQPKRLTMAQRATMEALESFGGIGLGAVPVRKRDLHSELKIESEQEKKRQLEDEEEETQEQPPAKRPRTRLYVAKQEAEEMFRDIPLAEGTKKNSRVYNLKVNLAKTAKRSKVTVRQTRASRARKEALETFGGASLDAIEVKTKLDTSKAEINESTSQPAKHLTRVERARLEALQSFGGGGLEDVMTASKKRIARTLEKPKKDEVGDQNGGSGEEETVEKENLDVSSVPMVTNTE